MLDLIFIQDVNCKIRQLNCAIVPCDNYHPALEFTVPIHGHFNSLISEEIRYNFKNADYYEINNKLISYNWLMYFDNNNLELSTSYFYDMLYKIIDSHVPKNKMSFSTYPIWYSTELKQLLKSKSEAHAIHKISLLPSDYLIFSDL